MYKNSKLKKKKGKGGCEIYPLPRIRVRQNIAELGDERHGAVIVISDINGLDLFLD